MDVLGSGRSHTGSFFYPEVCPSFCDSQRAPARQPYYQVNIPVFNSDISSGLNVTGLSQAGPGYSLGYSPVRKRIEGSLPNGNYVVEATSYGPNFAPGAVNLKVDGIVAEGPVLP